MSKTSVLGVKEQCEIDGKEIHGHRESQVVCTSYRKDYGIMHQSVAELEHRVRGVT